MHAFPAMRDGGTAMDAVFLFPAAAAPVAEKLHAPAVLDRSCSGRDGPEEICVRERWLHHRLSTDEKLLPAAVTRP